MSQDLERALRRPGALPALLTSGGILLALVVLGFLQATFSALSAAVQVGGDFFGGIWAAQLASALVGPLPIAIGVFVCFWQVAPIAGNLRLAHVVTRALLAAAAGAVLLFVLGLGYLLLTWLLGLAGRASAPATAGLYELQEVGGATPLTVLFGTLSLLVSVLPVVILGAVLLWGWLQRHPPKRPATGTLDEV